MTGILETLSLRYKQVGLHAQMSEHMMALLHVTPDNKPTGGPEQSLLI
jgi:hypothetical protein